MTKTIHKIYQENIKFIKTCVQLEAEANWMAM